MDDVKKSPATELYVMIYKNIKTPVRKNMLAYIIKKLITEEITLPKTENLT